MTYAPGSMVYERWPWIEDGNPHTDGVRRHRWAMREYLFTPEERVEILRRFPWLAYET